jgi:SPP1 gp7 family putative phage head morphogenesis protein|nr:MAG TPA: Minor capsid component [Caudoviricetes sp.]
MKYDQWKMTRRIEEDFLKSLNFLSTLFEKIAIISGNDVNLFQSKMQIFQNSVPYDNYINDIVKRMVTPLAARNYETWRKAARVSTRSHFLYTVLMEELKQGIKKDIDSQIISNAALIKTLPSDTAQKVVRDIEEYALSGLRAEEIEKLIQDKTRQHSRASARLIARTEVSKTTSALTKARSEELGLRWYVWRTMEDGDRVRKSHRIMNDVLVSWNNPPSPELLVKEKDVGRYHAGNIWNCRCYSEPLIDIDDVKWPHKVYINGSIQKMSKARFSLLI